MIVEPMVPRGLPRKEKKQNLGILTFYKVRLFNVDWCNYCCWHFKLADCRHD